MKKRKKLRDLNLLDRFLFSEAMEDKAFAENILSIIMTDEIELKYPPQTEKEMRNPSLKKTVKFDVWSEDIEDTIYGTESQGRNTGNLPKRSRYYQALTDCNLLEPGEIDYNKLKDTKIITIAPFDLFGEGRYMYTFRPMCRENPKVILEDGTERIFLNTRGTDPENITPELKALLEFVETPTEEVADRSGSEKIQAMYRRISSIKSSEEMGVRYMQAWEEIELAKQDAREELREKMWEEIELAKQDAREEVRNEMKEKLELAKQDAREEARNEMKEELQRTKLEVADQKTFEIAARLKEQGLSVEMIAAGTGLSRQEIEKL